MKLDKETFKSIVKECLVEILAEGLYPNSNTIKEKKEDLKENIQKRSIAGIGRMNEAQQQNVQKRKTHLDNVVYGGSNETPKQNSLNEKMLISKITKDPIMSEILADTAVSTLREQHELANKVAPTDGAAKIVAESDPEDLFGSSTGKWADLAFAPKINR